MGILWLIIMVAFLIIEGMTAQFVSIWFAVASVVSMVLSFFDISILTQIVVFAVLSLLMIIATKPFIKKFTKSPQSTNTDSLIGKTAVIFHEVDNLKETGSIRLNGVEWSVRSIDGEKIPEGEKVVIDEIRGVRLMVKKEN